MTGAPTADDAHEQAKTRTREAWRRFVAAQLIVMEEFLTDQARLTVQQQTHVGSDAELAMFKPVALGAVQQSVSDARSHLEGLSDAQVLTGWTPQKDPAWQQIAYPFIKAYLGAGYEPYNGAGKYHRGPELWKFYTVYETGNVARFVEKVPLAQELDDYQRTLAAIESTKAHIEDLKREQRQSARADVWDNS